MRSKHCVTRDSSDYLTYKTKQNLNFPFYPFPHLFMPSSLIKKKGQELKKYLRPHKKKGNKNLADFLNAPFAS